MSAAPGAPRATLALAAVATALFAVLAPAPHAESRLAVDVRPVLLDATDPARDTVGRLRFRGGLWIRSEDPRFGGLSDLRVTDEGRHLVSVSDCGSGFTTRLQYDASGALAGLDDVRLFPLLAPSGRPLDPRDVDAEAMFSDGIGYVVSFEGRHHFWRYSADPPLGGAPSPVPTPPGLASCGSNEGVEAGTRLDDGRLLLVCEGGASAKTSLAWTSIPEGWTTLTWPLFFEGDAPAPFHPTGAATLPGGDVIVIERRYPPIAARFRLLTRDAIANHDLRGTEVARLHPPLTLDNFEGIDAIRGPRGETLVYVVSDDNDCAKRGAIRRGLQRTLLLMFELGPDSAKTSAPPR